MIRTTRIGTFWNTTTKILPHHKRQDHAGTNHARASQSESLWDWCSRGSTTASEMVQMR